MYVIKRTYVELHNTTTQQHVNFFAMCSRFHVTWTTDKILHWYISRSKDRNNLTLSRFVNQKNVRSEKRENRQKSEKRTKKARETDNLGLLLLLVLRTNITRTTVLRFDKILTVLLL